MYCPAIWVDQHISLLRELLQGWPKKFGSIWLTRSLPLEHPAAAPLRAGSRLGSSLAVKDCACSMPRPCSSDGRGRPLGFLAHATIRGAAAWATPRKGGQNGLIPADDGQTFMDGGHLSI